MLDEHEIFFLEHSQDTDLIYFMRVEFTEKSEPIMTKNRLGPVKKFPDCTATQLLNDCISLHSSIGSKKIYEERFLTDAKL